MANRDLKHTSRPARSGSSAAKGGSGGVMLGIIIGLIVGVAVVVALAMYLNKSKTPFSNLEKLDRKTSVASAPPTELLAPGTNITEVKPATASAPPVVIVKPSEPKTETPVTLDSTATAVPVQPPATSKKVEKEEPRFDFYKILPGQGEATALPPKANKPAEPSTSTLAKKTYLQLGAFQNQDEADNLKAKLALLGVEATIQSVNIEGKGLVHRVRTGPYSRAEDMNRARAQLKQENISANVVKAE
ncbi:SPOR domain-containing protein [Neisseriaceae bacterium TC5R-5]|nr:SPOR domain-containing protein [Neisseriaceae bacterium TC5R-5]